MAAPRGDDPEAERTRLYYDAQRLGEENHWAEARDRLRRVVELRSAPKALIGLAFAEMHLGNLLEARTLYRRARDDARAAGIEEDVRSAQAGVEHVQKRIPRIVLVLPDEVAQHEIRVAVDRKRVLVRNGVVEVDPGERVVVVAALGRVPFRTRISVAEAERREVRVEFREETSVPSEPDVESANDPEETPGRSVPVGPVVLGGAGAIVAAVGAVIWIGGNSDYQAVVDECGATGAKCPEKLGENESRANDAISTIETGQLVVGVGAVLVAGAGVWWLLSGSNVAESKAPGSLGLRWNAGLTQRGFAASLGGAF